MKRSGTENMRELMKRGGIWTVRRKEREKNRNDDMLNLASAKSGFHI